MKIIGVDPGFSGAIAGIDDRDILFLKDMPTYKDGKKTHLDETAIRDIIENFDHVFIEKSQSMPGQGIASTASYMAGYGIIRGICVGLKIPYTLIHPRTWKKKMMMDMGKEKEASIIRAKQLYPEIELPRKKDHGKADALLIALYGRTLEY